MHCFHGPTRSLYTVTPLSNIKQGNFSLGTRTQVQRRDRVCSSADHHRVEVWARLRTDTESLDGHVAVLRLEARVYFG